MCGSLRGVIRKSFGVLRWCCAGLLFVSACAWAVEPAVKQVTSGPSHHFFGYIGHVVNTPWNASGRYMVLLQTAFQDRMPGPEDAAGIVILDTANDYALEKVEETRAWNPQQGTMLYWNPEKPEDQFFFNDRDPVTQKVFCVLYDLAARRRIKEFRFDDTPIGNSGVAQQGGFFLGLNYGRLDRLRKVTGYSGAYDWSGNAPAPENDGIFKVNVNSGEKTLLVSFSALADRLRESVPQVDEAALFINHTLWSRGAQRILFYVRGNWDLPGPRVNAFFTMNADGSDLTRHETFPGGHPEWLSERTVAGAVKGKQAVYDVATKSVLRELGDRSVFPNPEGDIALSPDGQWFVNGYPFKDENLYVIYHMPDGANFKTPGLPRGAYLKGDVRLDPAPCWRRDGKAIAVPALAGDGSRQTFVIEF